MTSSYGLLNYNQGTVSDVVMPRQRVAILNDKKRHAGITLIDLNKPNTVILVLFRLQCKI